MKNKVLIIGFGLMVLPLISCTEDSTYPHYNYGKDSYLPDSNKAKVADFIIKTTSAASSHMSTADYEDPEDLIEQIEETGTKLYSVQGEGLYKKNCESCVTHFLHKNELSKYQLKIFDSLKVYQK